MPISYNLLLNLVSASNASEPEVLWGFIKRYAPDATAETHPELDRMVGYAINYFHEFVAPTKKFRAPTDTERAAIEDLAKRFDEAEDGLDAQGLQQIVFDVGKAHEFDPLRSWFTALYEVLLGQSQGPRFGSFVELYGVKETVALIKEKLG